MEELSKVYIYLAVTLIFISFAVSPLYETVSAANKNNAKLRVKDIAGTINMVMASPSDNLVYTLDLPKNCAIEISSTFVRIRYIDIVATEEILQKNGFSVLPKPIDCNENHQQLTITKDKKSIKVS